MGEGMVSAICIKWREREILLLPNIDPAKPRGLWGLPGGKMKNGETPEQAALRELAEETGQEGVIGKYRAEIPKKGSEGEYTHYFITVKIIPGKELKNCGDSGVGEPKWTPMQNIITGRVKMFRGHIQGLILTLEKMTDKKISAPKFDRHGIRILSEGPSEAMELLAELKSRFDGEKKHVLVPHHLYPSSIIYL